MKDRVNRKILYLILVAFGAFIVTAIWPTNEIFGIPKDYWAGGAFFILFLVIVGWAAMAYYRGIRDMVTRSLSRKAPMEDRVRKVFRYVLYAGFLAFLLLLILQPNLPDEILGIPIPWGTWTASLMLGLILVVVGWRVVLWFRERGD